MRVLIADSDTELLKLMHRYFKNNGHEVETASNGAECLSVLHRFFMPEVLVLAHDLLWGGCAGILAELRRDPGTSRLPVILTTDSQEQFEALATSNVVARLQKPFLLKSLLQKIESAAPIESAASTC